MTKHLLLNTYRLGLLALFALPQTVRAAAYQGLGGAGQTLTAGSTDAITPLPTLIGGIIGVLLGILGIILVVYIVQAGIMYMTAAGDSTKVDKAKKMITQAVVGIIIIVAAYSISQFVINQISSATSPATPQQKLDNAING